MAMGSTRLAYCTIPISLALCAHAPFASLAAMCGLIPLSWFLVVEDVSGGDIVMMQLSLSPATNS